MRGQLTIARQGLIVVCLLLIVELFFIATVAGAINETRSALAKERKTIKIVSGISRLANLMQRTATTMARESAPEKLREMVGANSEDPNVYMRQFLEQAAELKRLIGKDPVAQNGVRQMQDLNLKGLSYFERQKDLFRLSHDAEKSYVMTLLGLAAETRDTSGKLLAHFKPAESQELKKTSQAIADAKNILIGGMIANLIALLVLAFLFKRRVTSRIDLLIENMRRFKQQETLRDKMKTRDEIGYLDQLFHEMADSLKEAVRREQDLIDGAYDVICTVDADGCVTNINAACQRQWGFDKQELIGEHVGKVVDEPDCAIVTRHLEAAKHKASAVDFEVNVRGRETSGAEKIVKTSWSCQWSAPEQTSFCFVRDVSEDKSMEALLKIKEEQVRSLMRNVPVGVLVTDQVGVVKSANQKMELFLNCQRGGILQQPLSAFFQAPGPGTASSISATAEHGEPLACKAQRADGTQFHAEITLTPLDEGALSDLLVVVEDASERVRLEAMKANFISLLGTSLRNPLLEVQKRIAAQLDRTDDEKLKSKLVRVCSSVERLLKLISELLDIETMGPGRIVGELKADSIRNIVLPAVDFLSGFSEKMGVPVKVETIDSVVMADSERLVQVVTNLLSNAIKYSPKGKEIVVACREEGDFVEVSIADGGKGVPPEMQDAIFRPYVQASADDARKGTGLGLPICKAIVESHHGKIGVVSKPGGGSKFWFHIPRQTRVETPPGVPSE